MGSGLQFGLVGVLRSFALVLILDHAVSSSCTTLHVCRRLCLCARARTHALRRLYRAVLHAHTHAHAYTLLLFILCRARLPALPLCVYAAPHAFAYALFARARTHALLRTRTRYTAAILPCLATYHTICLIRVRYIRFALPPPVPHLVLRHATLPYVLVFPTVCLPVTLTAAFFALRCALLRGCLCHCRTRRAHACAAARSRAARRTRAHHTVLRALVRRRTLTLPCLTTYRCAMPHCRARARVRPRPCRRSCGVAARTVPRARAGCPFCVCCL